MEFEQSNKQWMKSTATTLNKAAMAAAKDFYFTRMQEQVRMLKGTLESEWNERHQQTKTEALEHFEDNRPKFSLENHSYRQQLENVWFCCFYTLSVRVSFL